MKSKSIEPAPNPNNNNSEVRQKGIVEPELLSGMELVYTMLSEDGYHIVGSPSAGLAYFHEESDRLITVSQAPGKIEHISLETMMAKKGMKIAQNLGASFMSTGTQVLCCIGDVSQAGKSYDEAAMRTVLAYIRHRNLTEADQPRQECR